VGTKVRNRNDIRDQMKIRLNFENAVYFLVYSVILTILYNNLNIKIYGDMRRCKELDELGIELLRLYQRNPMTQYIS